MDHLLFCPRCRFWRDGLRVLPCCSAKVCAECVSQMTACGNCSAALSVMGEEYKPYKVMVDSLLRKCRHPGCGYLTTDLLLAHHEASCPHQQMNEVVAALGDAVETPQARAARIKKNLETLRPEKVVSEKNGKQYIEHLVLRTDTLVGLSMKYAVSAKDIQTANHLATGNVHERTRLKIPFTGKALPEENEDEVLAALRRLALAKFKGTTGLRDSDEALYYLDAAEFDVPAAVKQYREDLAWSESKKSAAPSSCIKRCASAPAAASETRAPTPPPSRCDTPPSDYAVSAEPLLADQSAYTANAAPKSRPNLLQEIFCGCFFSGRSRRR